MSYAPIMISAAFGRGEQHITKPKDDDLTGDGAEKSAQAGIDQILATRAAPTGIRAAVERLRAIDEDAQVIWKTKGARGTSTAELAGVMVELEPGHRSIVIVQEFASGKFKIFAEKTIEQT